MASGSGSGSGSNADDELARLTGRELVAHLRATTRRADYEAAARVLDARDRRLAETEAAVAEVRTGLPAALAEVGALREKLAALKAASRRAETALAVPEEAEEEESRADVLEGVSCKRTPSASCQAVADDEDDTIPLRQLIGRKRR